MDAASTPPQAGSFELNGVRYHLPDRPVAVICIDGCADEYLDEALLHERMPRTREMLRGGGARVRVRGALPSFTNVNNAALVTGAPPSVTGIAGNFFLDPATGEEVMMNSAEYLRSETILAKAAELGRRVALVTAKDKLRGLLSRGLERSIRFSAERAGEATLEQNGIADVESLVGAPTPEVYSGELSLYALRAGATLLERGLSDFLYLTLSDYVQHKHAPDEPEALEFYAGIDAVVGRLLDGGAIVGITADHGMNGKSRAGRPNVLYLESELRREFGEGVHVTCTITDPYVVHHGALGGFVVVHVAEPSRIDAVARACARLDGVTEVHDRETAARKLELPPDRIGDLVVMAGRDVALGRTEEHHDLSLLGGVLRSHGSRYEEMVPLLTSIPLSEAHRRSSQGDPRSFDLYRYLLDGDAR